MAASFSHIFIYVLLVLIITNVNVVWGEKLKRKRKAKVQNTEEQCFDGNTNDGTYPDHCKCLPHDSRGGRIAYLVTVHSKRTIDDAVPLIQSIWSPMTIVLIHVDSKTQREDYEDSELRRIVEDPSCKACGSDILVESRYNVEWGQWSMNYPTLWAMELLTLNPRYKDMWDVFMNLSGDSLPVYTPQKLSKMFDPSLEKSLYGINFVTSSSCVTGLLPTNILHFPDYWHKRGHYDEAGKFVVSYTEKEGGEPISTELTIHFGSQWMSLTPKFVEYIVLELRREGSLANAFKDALIAKSRKMSDETFIPTLLAHHDEFKTTLPKLLPSGRLEIMPEIGILRYDRLDENMPDAFGNSVDDQYYDVPKSAGVEKHRPWGPYYLGVYDLEKIKNSGAIFIRKVTKSIDPNLYNILPVDELDEIPPIGWPNEILIGEKPDFTEYKAYLRSQGRIP